MAIEHTCLRAARRYSALGWTPIPMAPHRPGKDKLPAVKWEQYQRRRSTEDEWRGWWRTGSGFGIAVVCGQISGRLVVLDFDRTGAYESWSDTHADIAALTAVAESRPGRRHVFLRVAEGELPGAEVGVIDGVDLRGEGSLVVVAPTIHGDTERPYRWLTPPEHVVRIRRWALTGLPLKRAAATTTVDHGPDPAAVTAGQHEPWVARSLAGVGKGQRNRTAFRLASYFRGRGIPRDVTEQILDGCYRERCVPPLPADELAGCVESAYSRYEPGPRVRGAGVSENWAPPSHITVEVA